MNKKILIFLITLSLGGTAIAQIPDENPLSSVKRTPEPFLFSVTTLTPQDLKFYNADLKYDWEPGEFQIMVGGNSKDLKMVKVNWGK